MQFRMGPNPAGVRKAGMQCQGFTCLYFFTRHLPFFSAKTKGQVKFLGRSKKRASKIRRILAEGAKFNEVSPKAHIGGVDSKSTFRCLPEVEIQQKIANWKAESARNPVSKESAPKDASIASYIDFESDRFAVGRLRRRAFGEKLRLRR